MKFPDSEALVVKFLSSVLNVPVSTKVPKERPDEFVRVWRTGGAALNRILDQPMITVQAWGVNSFDLVRECREALFNQYTLMPLVRGVEEVSGAYFDPDPDTNIDRYSCTLRLSVRAQRF